MPHRLRVPLALSPLSASMALGRTLNGANGETYDAMRTALRLDGMASPDSGWNTGAG